MPLGRGLRDALGQLTEWIKDPRELRRSLPIDETEHAALTERVKVVADVLQRHPDMRRQNGVTLISVRHPEGGSLTADEVRLAARIEDAYRSIHRP
jgi:pterin-4a-carbinolamine dehydratase